MPDQFLEGVCSIMYKIIGQTIVNVTVVIVDSHYCDELL